MTDINSGLISMIFDNLSLMKRFNKNDYADAFKEYCEERTSLFAAIDKQYNGSEDKAGFIDACAKDFIDEASARYDRIDKKSDKDHFLIDHNPILTVYMLPALAGSGYSSCRELAESICAGWNAKFTRYKISIGTFEEIDGGFKRKLCYITTAVCKSLGKPDDCYELRLLRDYRDSYLLKSDEGARTVNTYYDIAPTIVNRINRREDCGKIYSTIFNNYINPCIGLIEQGRKEECRDLYSDMVYSLEKEYMFSGRKGHE
ncbi:MAG: hypothetical protein K6F34_09825 [Lachnospiraceae bacterium]|nr:hypothetical protein [Lachnospiraceae bacterium]